MSMHMLNIPTFNLYIDHIPQIIKSSSKKKIYIIGKVFGYYDEQKFFKSKLKNIPKKFKFYNKIKHSIEGNFLFLDIKKTNPVLWEPTGFNNALKKIENDFDQIGKIIKDNNLELYILTYPWPDTLEYGQNSFNWEKFSNSLCIKSECSNLINLFPDFEKIKNNNNNWLYKIYIDGDLHITHFGHKIIAEKIINEVFLNE